MARQQAQPAGALIGAGETVHRVRIAASGEVFDCPSGRSVLMAALAADILMPSSCLGGRCGTCRGRILAGEVDYPLGQPDALDAAEMEAGYALFCSAHARSDLTIELPAAPPWR